MKLQQIIKNESGGASPADAVGVCAYAVLAVLAWLIASMLLPGCDSGIGCDRYSPEGEIEPM